ncbi:four helix bundle protein [uncultured Ralstonia sp.]|uniref:four helix bundle protein n=1 Tax=uncultured Ralstonia sp. TaxID=114715 RepID=UPI003416A503
MKIKSFEDLEVWRKAHELTLLSYRLTRAFPPDERFGLISQLRRASSSVAANIAEGYGRRTTKELLRSLRIANGEAEETRYFSLLSKDLSYMNAQELDTVNQLCRSVSQLLSALGRSLQASAARVSSHESRVTQSPRRQT